MRFSSLSRHRTVKIHRRFLLRRKENDDGGKKDRFVYFTRWRGAVSPSPLIDDDDDDNNDDDDDDDDDSIPPRAKAFRSGDISYPIPLLTRSFYPVNAAIIPSLFEPSFPSFLIDRNS